MNRPPSSILQGFWRCATPCSARSGPAARHWWWSSIGWTRGSTHIDRVIVLGADGLIADGSPDEVFREHASGLADAGVWVPSRYTKHTVPTSRDAEDGSGDIGAGRKRRETGGPGTVVAEAEKLAVARGGGIVATGLDVQVRAGRALAVTGPNGAGKSTLALALAGLIAPADGSYVAPSLAGELPERTRWWRRGAT